METMLREDFDRYQDAIIALKQELKKRVVGYQEMLTYILVCFFSSGLELNANVLLEGPPGTGKTLALRTLAKILDLNFRRVQFTPDKMPSEITGYEAFDQKTKQFEIKKGPIFSNFFLADEINRASGKTQSALLEAMQEGQVTIGNQTFLLNQPFMVLATQNPLEQRDTYPLGAAQLDRFLMKIDIGYPSFGEEAEIVRLIRNNEPYTIQPIFDAQAILDLRKFIGDSVYFDGSLDEYVVKIVQATRPTPSSIKSVREKVESGASPRGSIFLAICAKSLAFLKGRLFVLPEDIEELVHPILTHRVFLKPEYSEPGLLRQEIKDILDKVLAEVRNERPKLRAI